MSRLAGLGIGLAALLACGASVLVPEATASEGPEVKGREDHRHKSVHVLRGGGGYLGIELREVAARDLASLKLSEERGAVVETVAEGSPAEKAGLREGDVILRYQGQAVEGVAQLVRMVRETPPGRKVALEVSREGAPQTLQATLDERPPGFAAGELLGGLRELPEMLELPDSPEAPLPRIFEGPSRGLKLRDFAWQWDRGPRKLGIQYQEIEGQLAKYFKLADERGLLVTEVEEDGPAGRAGIKAGDVLLRLNGRALRDGDDLRNEVRRLEAGEEATLTVQREGRSLDLKLTVGGRREPHREHDRDGETT
jgi:serine protease Do